ncbi:hypothetical protein G205_11905 [Arthrobacter nitrophenolicus]|uniref:Uncharacterized protein n=1 Tax=Arthrobacter nitrophenolicus TaxID=683150 RepID=L8TMC0_9MICC|nr:hypothetical protein G205_11905 [Arthrobacter nitrophenolicus]
MAVPKGLGQEIGADHAVCPQRQAFEDYSQLRGAHGDRFTGNDDVDGPKARIRNATIAQHSSTDQPQPRTFQPVPTELIDERPQSACP